MASTKTPVQFDHQLRGVDSTSEGILVSDDAWMTQHNMRSFQGKIQQVPRKVLYGRVESCYPHPILSLHHLPSSIGNQGHVVGLSPEHVWQLRNPVSSSIKLRDYTGEFILQYDSKYRRWGTTVYSGQLFFVNELNPVAVTDGSSARFVSSDAPKARYITNYFDHLVVGWVSMDGVVMPGRMHWSHLYSPSQWRPAQTNESDHWDFDEDLSGTEALRGVTGLARLGGALFVVTNSSIRPVQYVGLPKVFKVGDDITGGIGNCLQWGMVTVNNSVIFFDAKEWNFFSFSLMGGLKAIGGAVQGFLSANINPSFELQQRTWAYVRPETNEVAWVFVSKNATTFDKAVVFNYRTEVWFTCSVEDLHSFAGGITPAKAVGALSGAVNSQTGEAGALGSSSTFLPRVWGGPSGSVLREETDSDNLSTLLEQELPVLETKDHHYGDIRTEKEIDTLTLNSSYESAKGVAIEYCGRRFVDDEVAYKGPKIWTPYSDHGHAADVRFNGRIMRLRYTPVSTGPSVETSTGCATGTYHGSLLAELNGSREASHDTVFAGLTDGYILNSHNAPSNLIYDYIYGAPSTVNPYAIPQSSGMIEDCRSYGRTYLAGLGYTGFSSPAWVYALASMDGWLHVQWPSWGNDPPGPINFTEGWYLHMYGYLNASNPSYDYSDDPAVKTGQIAGIGGTGYIATIRVRARFPLTKYNGGSYSGYLQTGGSPATNTSALAKLQVGANVYYLNRGGTGSSYLTALDYTFEVNTTGGSNIALTLDPQLGFYYSTDSYGRTIYVAGLGASSKLQVAVDYKLRLATGTQRTIVTRAGGGVRGWKWSSQVHNIYSGKAEK